MCVWGVGREAQWKRWQKPRAYISHVCRAEGQPRLRLRDRRLFVMIEDPCRGLSSWSGVFWRRGLDGSLVNWIVMRMGMSVDMSFEEFS